VHNPIAITFEAGALVIRFLRDGPASCAFGKSGARTERRSFALLAKFPTNNWARSGASLGT